VGENYAREFGITMGHLAGEGSPSAV
jgi:hypothetical protein